MMENQVSHPVPVVRLIIPNDAGKVIILCRQNTVYSGGQWNLPGGKVDYGSTVEDEVRKELIEETSLVCTSMRFLFYQDSLPLRPGGLHCINFYFECVVRGDLRLNEESSQFAWIGPQDLSSYQLTFRNEEGLLRYWKESRGT
jgi:ADP-ribose pyrophosphatase YjhB (NUDIX family)